MPEKYPVIEIFKGIQGEGVYTGEAVIFIRFAGCNLSCPWCDTKNSWTNDGADMMTSEEILDVLLKESKESGIDKIVFTGGEPLMYDLKGIVQQLHNEELSCHVETNGTLETEADFDWVTVSPKPSEYEIVSFNMIHEVKLVVDETLTVERALAIADAMQDIHGSAIYLQPEANNFAVSVEKAAAWVLQYPDKFCLGAQMHKYWGIK